jgi:predicted amidohydrolase YtcJ
MAQPSPIQLLASAALFLTTTLSDVSAAAPSQEADLILTHGAIFTPTGWAQALAIKSGVIVAIGEQSVVDPYRTNKTQVIDLEGAAVLPGLHDMHVHPLGAGQTELGCKFAQGSAARQVLAAIQKCVGIHAKGEWILGGQWDAASFGQVPPNREQLDSLAPDNPVALVDISGHSLWVNSKALALAGIGASTPNPQGGIIERDAKGEPTGVLRESAGALVRRIMPPFTAAQNTKALAWALHEMLSYGITSFVDAAVDESGMQAYTALADQGSLKQRVQGCLLWHRSLTAGPEVGSDFIARRNLYARARFAPTCIKMFLDGVPTDSHTAAMLEPYEHVADLSDVRARGLLMASQPELNADVARFDAQGFTVKFHAAGDAAVRAALNAIDAARKANGFSGQLHSVAHDSFVQMDDIRRARGMAATFEFSPYIWFPNPIIPDIVKAVGEERMRRWIPVKDAIDAGALVVAGSDWSVVPSVNPWIAIETLVTRQRPGGGGETLGAVERISLQQAIDLFTVNSARQMGNGNKTGSLERGLLADLIVLDRNPLKIPVTQIHETRVKMTLVNGEIVYSLPHR